MGRGKNEYLKASVRTGSDINLFLLEALVCRDETSDISVLKFISVLVSISFSVNHFYFYIISVLT